MRPSLISRATAITTVFGFALLNSACSRDQTGPVGPFAAQRAVNSLEASDPVYGRVTPDDGLASIKLVNTPHTMYFTVEDATGAGGLAYRLDVDAAGTTGVSQVSVAAGDQCGILAPFQSRQVAVTYTTVVAGMGRVSVLGRFSGEVGFDGCPIYPGWSVDAGSVRVPIQNGPLTTTISGPGNIGHYDTCGSWAANVSGGVPPYAYYWAYNYGTSATGFYFGVYPNATTNAWTQTVQGWGYYYGSYPPSGTVHAYVSVTDAAGQILYTNRDISVWPYSTGCY